MDADILNAAITLRIEWGENFGKPIEGRLIEQFPQLTDEQASAYAAEADSVKSFAFETIELGCLKQITADEERRRIKERFPGLDEDNDSGLKARGMYYAWHDNG